MIKDLNLEGTDESVKYKKRKKSIKEQKLLFSKTTPIKQVQKENSDLSTKANDECHRIDLKSVNDQLLNDQNNNSNVKNQDDLNKDKSMKPSNQTSSSDDSYSLDSESSSSSSSSDDESKSSSTSDLRTMNDFNLKLSDQFDKFDNILCSKCDEKYDDDDVFESTLLNDCNNLSSNFLTNLYKSNSTICLPTYLDEMYGTLRVVKETNCSFMQNDKQNGNQSTRTTPKQTIKSETDQLTSNQFHKDILLNLQKKFYFYKLIYVYPYLFPVCCRQQHDFNDQLDQINQTVHSDKEYFINKSTKPIKPCIHSFSCDYDLEYDKNFNSKCSAKCDLNCDANNDIQKDDSKQNTMIRKNSNSLIKSDVEQSTKNVEFLLNDTNNNISPTTSTITTSTTTSTTNPINHKITLKPLPNKSVGQSLISSFVQLEPGKFSFSNQFN